MQTKSWLIYGANGYTGELIAREAARQGLTPILAGRNRQQLDALGEELGLDVRIFSIKALQQAHQLLDDIDLVLNCAGPYSSTAETVMQACLGSKTHYLDITGEIAVFERAQQLHDQAQACGIILCPGVGFDVIPTDCLAVSLKQKMLDATDLMLGFDSRSKFSPGTAKTSIEGLAQGGKIRKDGQIQQVPLAFEERTIDFGGGEKLAMTIPWGDVSTAYWSTGIKNIKVFIPTSPGLISKVRKLNWIRPILGLSLVQTFMKNRIDKKIEGPSMDERQSTSTWVWGQVRNQQGQQLTARVRTENGYSVTINGSLAVVQHVLNRQVITGYHTPTTLMGVSLLEALPGSSQIEFQS